MTRIMVHAAITAAIVVLVLQGACWLQADAACRRRGGTLVAGRSAWHPECVAAP
jgi:hypothetical protein